MSDGSGVDVDYEGQWTLPLRFGQEVTSTEPALGKEMKSLSWRTGHNTLYVKNVVEEDGIEEVKNVVFYPHGAQVRNDFYLTKPDQNCESFMCLTVTGILYRDKASRGYESNSVRVAGESG